MDSRLNRLEERIAYQDKLIFELDEVIREFGTRITALERQFAEAKEGATPASIGPQDDPPPHY